MATTQIADLLTPEVWIAYMTEEFPEQLALLSGGIMAPPPESVARQMNAGGRLIQMPFWDDLTRSEADVMSDDDTTEAVPAAITADKDQAVKHYLHKSWSAMDLAGMLATGIAADPINHILRRMGQWWANELQSRVIKTCTGIFADNADNDSSDMIYNIYSDATTPAASTKISAAAVDQARLTMGDRLNELTAISVHSSVYGTMLANDAITFIQESQLPGQIPIFMNKRVFVDDDHPVAVGTNSDAYTCYLYGAGAFAYYDAVMGPEQPFERERKPAKGNGGGQTIIHTRKHMLLHPRGIKWTDTSCAGQGPTWAEMVLAANWDRVFVRKNIRVAELVVNI